MRKKKKPSRRQADLSRRIRAVRRQTVREGAEWNKVNALLSEINSALRTAVQQVQRLRKKGRY